MTEDAAGMGCFERIISMNGRLQGKPRSNRRLLFGVSTLLLVLQIGMSVVPPYWTQNSLSIILVCVCQLVILVPCFCSIHLSHNIMRVYTIGLFVSFSCGDLSLRTIGSPPLWPCFVLLADLSLVLGLGRRFATGITGAAAAWVAITTAEGIMRFGMLDLPGSAPDSLRWERLQDTVQCTDPPCPVSAVKGLYEMHVSLFVLLVDFAATRGFADSAEREKAAMGRTIETVEAIAQLLAGYDVDTVAEMLQEAEAEGRLPAAMHEALHRLEQNLRAYRPYLPKSCLPAQDDISETASGMSSSYPDTGSDSTDVPQTRTAAKVLGAMKTVRATLLVVNTRNALACLEEDPRTFTSFFEMLLTNTMSAVESRRGLVDVFLGDRILASFNTSRPCVLHATAAAGAAQQIVQKVRAHNTYHDNSTDSALRVNIGAASGYVLCGDTGCLEMRRFSLLGVLPVLACGMERAARAFDLDVVCSTALRQDAEHEHVLLLVPRMVHVLKAGARDDLTADSMCRVYELLITDMPGDASLSRDGEWMYHIGKDAAEWEPYNAAMRAYLSGTNIQDAAEMAGERHRQAHSTISLLGHTTPLAVHV